MADHHYQETLEACNIRRSKVSLMYNLCRKFTQSHNNLVSGKNISSIIMQRRLIKMDRAKGDFNEQGYFS